MGFADERLGDFEGPDLLDGFVEDLCVVFGGEEVEVVAEEFDALGVGEGLEADGPVGSPHEASCCEVLVEALYLRLRVEVGVGLF